MKVVSRWRLISREVIAQVKVDNPGVTDEKELRKLFSASYPFGERRMLPYKLWLEEIKIEFGYKKVAPSKAERLRVVEETHGSLFE